MWQKHAAGGERPVHFARGYAQSQRFEDATLVVALRMPVVARASRPWVCARELLPTSHAQDARATLATAPRSQR